MTQVEKKLIPRSVAIFQTFASLLDLQDKELTTPQIAEGTNGISLDTEILKLTAEVLSLR